ncbi:MAG: type II toxin-antitoxin system HigB family toxin [Aphanocapsa sp. GSE-SYN-MK-11-07L]|jgi:mRNA interferase HigB|nr:type II toxin-antitoxin system HigB family toxin [Aphanocapsa sp. GSE-SYN-MK-11-07L]
MHIISLSRLREFYEVHFNARSGLLGWYKIASNTRWQNFDQVRQTYPSADQVGNFAIFDIGGNNFRLIVLIDYNASKIFIRHVLTHADYDKNKWKNDSWFN